MLVAFYDFFKKEKMNWFDFEQSVSFCLNMPLH